MNNLETYFRNNDKRLIHKWYHYFEAHHNHFQRFRDKEIVILEIGVSQGGSLQMWKDYFSPKAKIYGIDMDPRCKQFEEKNIEIFIGSQSDRNFLREFTSKIPKPDILIDDVKVNDFTKKVKPIHCYDSIVVLEKGKVDQPIATMTGTPTLMYSKEKKTGLNQFKHLLISGIHKHIRLTKPAFSY